MIMFFYWFDGLMYDLIKGILLEMLVFGKLIVVLIILCVSV